MFCSGHNRTSWETHPVV